MSKAELEDILITAATAELATRYMLRGNTPATAIMVARTRALSAALKSSKGEP